MPTSTGVLCVGRHYIIGRDVQICTSLHTRVQCSGLARRTLIMVWNHEDVYAWVNNTSSYAYTQRWPLKPSVAKHLLYGLVYQSGSRMLHSALAYTLLVVIGGEGSLCWKIVDFYCTVYYLAFSTIYYLFILQPYFFLIECDCTANIFFILIHEAFLHSRLNGLSLDWMDVISGYQPHSYGSVGTFSTCQ